MFKKLIKTAFIALSFSGFCIVKAQGEIPDVVKKYFRINENEKMKLSAGVKKCTEIRLGSEKNDTISISFFNSSGKLQQQYVPAEDSNMNLWDQKYYSHFYLYDNYGKIIQRIDSLLPAGECRKTILNYDELGNLVKEEQRSGTAVKIEVNYDYDPMGRVIESATKDAAGNCRINEKYLYNTYNDLARSVRKDNCGDGDERTLTVNYTYKYNKLGLITEKISIFSDSRNITETFKYDDKGNLTEAYSSSSPGSYVNYIYKYDAGGKTQTIEITETKNENVSKMIRTVNYDKFGNKLEESCVTDSNKEIYRIQFIYE